MTRKWMCVFALISSLSFLNFAFAGTTIEPTGAGPIISHCISFYNPATGKLYEFCF